jgi:hypothetical protein
MADRIPRIPTERMTEGALVIDRDGEELGTLSASHEGYFKVNAPRAFDYWLPFDTLDRVDGDRVVLTLTKDQVEERKLDAGGEDLTPTEIEESLSPTNHPAPMERRYDNQADYFLHPRPRI